MKKRMEADIKKHTAMNYIRKGIPSKRSWNKTINDRILVN